MELTRRALDAITGVDLTRIPNGGFDPRVFDPEMDFDLGQLGLPDESRWRGPDGVIEGWQRWLAQWDDYSVTGSRLEQVDDDTVIVDIHAEARGRGSGVPMAVDNTQVWSWRDGKILRIRLYEDRAEALEALTRGTPSAGGGSRTPRAG